MVFPVVGTFQKYLGGDNHWYEFLCRVMSISALNLVESLLIKRAVLGSICPAQENVSGS